MSLTALLALATPGALAGTAAPPGEGHDSPADLPRDSAISLPEAVAAAAERQRLGEWRRQRAEVAAAERARGRAWLGDVPSLGGNWYDYRSLENQDVYEAELFVALPLWRAGERRARRELGGQDAALAQAQGRARLLVIAGDVRQALWQLLDARTRVALLAQGEASAGQYAEQMAQRLAGGDASRADMLQSRELVLKLRSQVLDARAQLVDRSRRWRLITGLGTLPQEPVEQASAIEGIRDDHPLQQQAAAQVALRRAELEALRRGGSQRPTLQLGVRREDLDELVPPLNSISIGFEAPLGRGRDNAVAVRQAEQALLEAEVALQTLRRQLLEELHDVRHQIGIVDSHLAGSADLLSIAGQVLEMQQLANRAGDVAVIEVLRAGQALAQARQHHAILTLQRQALTAQYNQAVGELPQ